MKRLARLGSVFAILLSTLSGCGGGGEAVTARFVSAAPLVEGNQVKLDGIVVGEIASMRVRHGLAEVTMNLQPEAMPLHRDATFTIRPASLLGERYVDLDRGSPGAPALDPSQAVPASQTATNVGLDEVLNTMDDPASEGLAMLTTTLGTGVRGNGAEVDETVRQLGPDMKEIRALAAVLKNHNELLGSLVEDAEPIAGALADRDGATLDQLVSSSDQLLNATASQQEDLERTLERLPGTLKTGRETLKTLSDTADEAAPTLDALDPFIDDLPDISRELEDFSDALDPALATSQPVLDRAEQLLVEAQRPADDLRIGSPGLAATVHGTVPVVHGLTEDRETMFRFIRNWALNTNGFDGLSHYWRVILTLNSDTWTSLLDILGLPALPTGGTAQTQTAVPASTSSAAAQKVSRAPDAPELINGVVKPLTGLTGKLTDGSLLGVNKTADGSSTGLNKKQESNLLGFLFGGGE
jgi:phospholipid/cholesterol/gamma-HCH transport system substrate-binding protein